MIYTTGDDDGTFYWGDVTFSYPRDFTINSMPFCSTGFAVSTQILGRISIGHGLGSSTVELIDSCNQDTFPGRIR
jgi:hypothetical protein